MAIEQHPIPQDVAGYKFRLIGEMTIKQFAFLASGIILGLIIYSLPLPFFFKYPLAAIAVGLGAGIAFLPIEGRPMDKWLIAFIKSIYSPTEYVWQKQEGGEVITAAKAPTRSTAVRDTAVSSPESHSGQAPAPTPVPPTAPISPTPTPAAPPAVPPVAPPAPAQSTVSQAPTPTVPKAVAPAPALTPVITTPPKPVTPPVAPVQVPAPITPPVPTPPTPAMPREASREVGAAPAAVNLPVPFTPTTPNTLVGMTLTPDGKILDGALIEIRSKGLSLRATKSNQLGQFLFAKPLENGLYQIVTEKAGYLFDTYSIDLRGQIIKPLKLQAKAHV